MHRNNIHFPTRLSFVPVPVHRPFWPRTLRILLTTSMSRCRRRHPTRCLGPTRRSRCRRCPRNLHRRRRSPRLVPSAGPDWYLVGSVMVGPHPNDVTVRPAALLAPLHFGKRRFVARQACEARVEEPPHGHVPHAHGVRPRHDWVCWAGWRPRAPWGSAGGPLSTIFGPCVEARSSAGFK